MNRVKGFTLLEVLVVVVIAASILLFAVPAYKRMQDRTSFMAAQGVLISIGTAVRSLRAEVTLCSSSLSFPANSPIQVTPGFQKTSDNKYSVAEKTPICEFQNPPALYLPYALFAQKFLEPIPFTKDSNGTTTNKYGNYEFYICPQNQGSNKFCCGNDKKYVACMLDTGACTRPTNGLYYGARFLQDGTVERVEKTCSSSSQEEEERVPQTRA